MPLRLLIVLMSLTLTACSGHMTLTKNNQFKASNTIFLTPTSDKSVYLAIRNTTDKPNSALSDLPDKFTAKGYTVVDDPEKAHFVVQVNTVYASKMKPGTTIDSLIAGGFGAGIGGSIGAAAALGGHGFGFIPGGAAVGAGVGFLGERLTQDTIMALVADVQILEKTKETVEQAITTQTTPGGGLPSQAPSLFGFLNSPSLASPNAGQTNQTISEVRKGNERLHTSRLVSSSQQMWLSEEGAYKDLTAILSNGVVGLF